MQNYHHNRLTLILILTFLIAACAGEKKDVPCTQDSDCDLTTGGVCAPAATGNMWCAFPDADCPSGLRYSDQGVGDDLGGTCIPGTLPTKYTLTVALGGSGMGGVTTAPAGLTCSGDTCTAQYDEGAVVQLTATPTMGQFLGWSQACSGAGSCSVTMTADQQVGALFGVPGQALWANQFGSAARDAGHGLVIDGNDAVITVGEFSGTIMFGTTALTSAGGTDIYVAKIQTSDGSVVWAKRFGGTSNDVGLDVAVDGANNVYVTGRFLGSVDFGGGALQSGALDDAFALKLGSDGSFGWARKIGGAGFDVGQGIAARGNAVVVVGFFNGSMTVDTTTLTSAGSSDIFAMSMATSNGATSWVKSFGGTNGDLATDVAIDNADNVVITGSFAGTVNFGGGAISTPGGFSAVLLLKIAGSNGAHLLSQGYGASDAHSRGYGIAIDSANSILLTGEFGGTVSFTCPSAITASQPNLLDAFLVKLTQAGSCSWVKGFGGTGAFDRNGRGVTVGGADAVAISGSFCGSMTFGGPTLTAAGMCANQDVYAARFMSDGTYLNSVRVGGTGSEFAFGVGQSADGRFYVTGSFQGLAEFGGDAFTSAGDTDAFVVGLEAL